MQGVAKKRRNSLPRNRATSPRNNVRLRRAASEHQGGGGGDGGDLRKRDRPETVCILGARAAAELGQDRGRDMERQKKFGVAGKLRSSRYDRVIYPRMLRYESTYYRDRLK